MSVLIQGEGVVEQRKKDWEGAQGSSKVAQKQSHSERSLSRPCGIVESPQGRCIGNHIGRHPQDTDAL